MHTEAEARVGVLSNSEDAAAVGRTSRITLAHISQYQYYTHDQQPEQYGPPCSLCGGFNHSPKHCYKGEHDINNIMEKMSIILINPNRAIYISNGDHDNPYEPPQIESEGCSISHNALYSHQIGLAKESEDFEKLFYIY